jgi:hypothetical protein
VDVVFSPADHLALGLRTIRAANLILSIPGLFDEIIASRLRAFKRRVRWSRSGGSTLLTGRQQPVGVDDERFDFA